MKYRDNMTAEEQAMLLAQEDALADAYASADLARLASWQGKWEPSDEDLDPWLDLVRDAERA